jgi:large subunit ribosomal protein L13
MICKRKTKYYQDVERKWVIVDAKGKVAGRLATRLALILNGKNKATFTPNAFCGDRVIVINAKHVVFTGNKNDDKLYQRYSGYPKGIPRYP